MTGWNEFDAAAHVLRDPLIASKTNPFIEEQPPRIEFDALLSASEIWSHGERLLVLAALDLWNGRAAEVESGYGMRALANRLSNEQIERIIEGLRILCRMSEAVA